MTKTEDLKLEKYQILIEKEVFDKLENGINPVLALDTGLGKTYIALSLILRFLKKQPRQNILVLVRKTNLYDPWIQTFEAHHLNYQKYHSSKRNYLVIQDTDGNSYIGFLKNKVIISTYNIYMKEKSLFKNIDFVIMDEIHTFNNTKRMGVVFNSLFSLKAKYKLALTATPVQNLQTEIITLYYMLNNPAEFDEDWLKIPKNEFAEEEQRERIAFCLSTGFLIVRSKDKLQLEELPSKTEIAFLIPMNKLHKDDFMAKTAKKYDKRWTNKIMDLTESEIKLIQEKSKLDMPLVSDFLRVLFSRIPRDDKIIVFSSYIDTLYHYCNIF